MAFPCGFAESNTFLAAPPGTDEYTDTLEICSCHMPSGLPVMVSCWKITAEELLAIERTGRIWIGVIGNTMPPLFVAGEKPMLLAGGAS